MRAVPFLALLLACNPSSSDEFTGGNFSFQTTAVTDACFDGGFESIFMPEGPSVPNEFGAAIYVPGADELPTTYGVDLQPPFDDMDVTVTGDASTRTITGAENTGVELDADQWPGCLVDASIDVDLTIVDADTVNGTAVLHTSSFDEESCPEVSADPCDITLTLSGARAE